MKIIQTLFENSDLSTEFKEKVSVVFEAAVSEQSSKIVAEQIQTIEESFNRKLDEAKEEFITEQTSILESFIDRVVQEWIEENAPALDSKLKTEISESFLDGLKNLFLEHNIDLESAENAPVIESLESRVSELELQLEETIAKGELVAEAYEEKIKEDILAEATIKLPELQAQRVAKLCENFEFNSVEDYKQKVGYIVEAFSGNVGYIPPTPPDYKDPVVQLGFIDPETGEYSIATSGEANTGIPGATIEKTNQKPTQGYSLVEMTLKSIR